MVNFDSDGTLGTNRSHILDLIVLGRRDEFLNTYQKYKVAVLENKSEATVLFNILRGILETITLELRETMNRKWGKEFEEFEEALETINEEQELKKAFIKINALLDQLNITKIDTKRYIDTTSVETENAEKGL